MKAPHYFLCSTRPLKDGTCPLQLVIYRRGTRAQISTGVRLLPSQWDGARVINHPSRAQLNNVLNQRRTAFETAILAAEAAGELSQMTAGEVARLIQSRLSGAPTDAKSTFADVFAAVVEGYAGRTRELYTITRKRLQEYDSHFITRTFEEVDARYIQAFERWLARTSPSVNARAIHLRNIRHVFNVAIDNEETTAYPFRKLKIKAVETKKRALSADALREYFSAVPATASLQKWHDLMKLTFMLIGINCADLYALRREDYQGGRIQYRRQKTGRLYNIRVEPEAAALIERWKGNARLLFPADRFAVQHDFLKYLNKRAKQIDPRFAHITTYVLRHSWATIAYNDLGISKDTISQALGHQYGSRITSVYIDADTRLIDEANRRVLDWVLYAKR